MTPTREAIVLPLLFLSVALLGGLRLSPGVRLVPPPLISLYWQCCCSHVWYGRASSRPTP